MCFIDPFFIIKIQCQIFCTKRSYCDLVVWTEKDVHIERIYPDEEFWYQKLPKVQHFFTTAILPELLGRFYSRNQTSDLIHSDSTSDPESSLSSVSQPSSSSQSVPAQSYCYCHGPDEGDMVGCDNPSCLYQWFHFDCLGLKSQPKSKKWFCPECRKLPQFQLKKKRKTTQN